MPWFINVYDSDILKIKMLIIDVLFITAISKSEAINLIQNIDLTEKSGTL